MKAVATRTLFFATVAILFSARCASAAQIPDGGFEVAIPGFWTTAGDVAVVNSPLDVWSATEGSKFIAISTDGTSDGSVAHTPGTPLPFSANPALDYFDLEVALGLPAFSLSALNASEGSGIVSAPFVTPSGATFLYADFEFLTNELDPPPPGIGGSLNDFAFYSLDGADPVIFYDAFETYGPVVLSGANDYFKIDSGLAQTLAIPITPGTHTIAFGVADWGDVAYNSGLYIDNVRFSEANVPEPSTIVLLGIASLGLPLIARRRHQAKG